MCVLSVEVEWDEMLSSWNSLDFCLCACIE